MCLLSHRKFFISNSLIFAQMRAYLLVFACLFGYSSLFSHVLHIFTRSCALTRNAMRDNAHARILVKDKEAEHQSPKRQSRLSYSSPLGASGINGPSRTADTWGLSPTAGTTHLSLSPMSAITHLSLSPMNVLLHPSGGTRHRRAAPNYRYMGNIPSRRQKGNVPRCRPRV